MDMDEAVVELDLGEERSRPSRRDHGNLRHDQNNTGDAADLRVIDRAADEPHLRRRCFTSMTAGGELATGQRENQRENPASTRALAISG